MTQTIGQRLKAEREEKRLTLEKVFEATRIRIQYLQALEADDLSPMPSPVQARGYLRNYAEYLGLNFEQILDEMRAAPARSSGEIIGPADNASALQPSIPLQDDAPVKIPSETQSLEPTISEVEASTQQNGLTTLDESSHPQPDSLVLDTVVEQTKPKSARRKKAESQSQPDSAQLPKRRGRKKTEADPELSSAVESQPEIVEEPVAPIESVPQPAEPVVVEMVETLQDDKPQPDISDNLWQTWLNRLNPKHRESDSPESKHLEIESPESDGATAPLSDMQEQIPALQSTEIFKEVGVELRKRRELLSLNLEEVERNTRVKAHYLDSLEKGAMDNLPSTVQTRGMLSNYATFLDLDVDVLLLRYADALQARHRERNPQKPARKPGQPIVANIPSIRSFIAGDIVFGIGIAVLLAGFSIWGVSRVLTIQREREIQSSAPSISDVLLASPDPSQFTATATFLPADSLPGEPTITVVIPTQNVNVQVQVNLVAVERTYMRVIVDGEVAFEGRVVPGNAYPFEAENQVEVLVGSGAAIRIVYNGRDLGLLGSFGQVVSNIYLADGIITPTALPTPTLTSTVPPTSTSPPTPTERPTSTPVPSDTSSP